MRRRTLILTAALSALAPAVAASPGLGHTTATIASGTTALSRPLSVQLNEEHASGVSGTALLSPPGKGVRVVLTVDGPVEGSLPAHIHTGRCKNEPTFANPRIWASLKNVVNGRSVTAVTSTSLKTLRRSRFSINVHDPHTLGVIACGDIPLARR